MKATALQTRCDCSKLLYWAVVTVGLPGSLSSSGFNDGLFPLFSRFCDSHASQCGRLVFKALPHRVFRSASLGDASEIFNIVGQLSYVALAAVALWGIYYVFLVLTRVNAKRFKTEKLQDAFVDSVTDDLRRGNFDAVISKCEGSKKALPMMVTYLCKHRAFGMQKARQMTLDRFQRDVIADLDYSIAWIVTVIKTAPMLGLFGTVVGMMGAFGKLASATNVNPTDLAGDIRVALETTAIGLTIAIPLVMAMAAIHNRIRHMQDLVGSGLAQILDSFKIGMAKEEQRGSRQSA